MKIILLILIIYIILNNIEKLLSIEGAICRSVVIYIGFCIYPIIGWMMIIIYFMNWFNDTERKTKKRYKKYYTNHNNNNQNHKTQYNQKNDINFNKHSSYFKDCKTKDELKKRHRELSKKYHPDKGGDIEIFKMMQTEYDIIKNTL